MAQRRNWSRDETLLAFRLYCYTPFGKLTQHNPDIIALTQLIGRTPSAVAMKGCNFASLDPLHQQRGVVGLQNRGQLEEQIWQQFIDNSESIAAEAEAVYESLAPGIETDTLPESPDLAAIDLPKVPGGPTEIERTIRTRRVQGFFRKAVLAGYGHRCALTNLAIPELLIASHIIPWAICGTDAAPACASGGGFRADPSNGLCLNALHDRAFDRGLITFDPDHRLLLSPRLTDDATLGQFAKSFTPQTQLTLPERFAPSPEALNYHREMVFQAA